MRVLALALLCAVANSVFLGRRKTKTMRNMVQDLTNVPGTAEKFMAKEVDERRKLYTGPEEFDEAAVRAQLTEEGIFSERRILLFGTTTFNNPYGDCDGHFAATWMLNPGYTYYYSWYYDTEDHYYVDCETEEEEAPPTNPPTSEPESLYFGLEGGFFEKNPGVEEYELEKDVGDDGSNYKVGKYQIGGINFEANDFGVDGSGHGDSIITQTVPANDEQGNPIAFGEWEGLNLKVDDDLGLMCQVIYDISNDADLSQLFGDWFGCSESSARRRALVMWLSSGRKMSGKRVKAIYDNIVEMQAKGDMQRTRLMSSYADGQNNL